MRIGNRDFDFKKNCYVMGILNVTPDSFSDGGRWTAKDAYLYRVEEMLQEGMDILDIGGESTRPGYETISVHEETERVCPVILAIKERFDVPISLDTYKADVAKAGIDAGAHMINDIWGLLGDECMGSVIAQSGVPCVLMHNRSQVTDGPILDAMAADFARILAVAAEAGIADDKIILDPGVGFGKTYEQNLEAMAYMDKLHMFGYPLLLGASRKSVIGLTLDLPVEERLEGTLATTVMAVTKGASIVRVHDVKENVRAIRMAQAILQGGQ